MSFNPAPSLKAPLKSRVRLPVVTVLALVLFICSPVATAAPSATAPHITRTAQIFIQLEESLQQALRDGNTSLLEAMLGEEFQMIGAQDPGSVTPREEWLLEMRQDGATAYAVERMAVREIGAVAIASFVLRPRPKRAGASPVAVVDVWERDGVKWVLTTRHAAPLNGPRQAVPGETKTPALPKQI